MRVSLKKRGAVIFWDSVLLPKSNKFRAVFTALFVNIDLKFVFKVEGLIFNPQDFRQSFLLSFYQRRDKDDSALLLLSCF